jgi:hypothetical protein
MRRHLTWHVTGRAALWAGLGAAWLGSLVLAVWLVRPADDAAVPPYARSVPFSRGEAVAIALREWRAFGSPVVDAVPPDTAGESKPERQPGLWERVGDYWWLGPSAPEPFRPRTGKHDETGAVFPPDRDGDYAWSAVFIDYVLRMAGAGRDFPYGISHAVYIHAAIAGQAGLRALPVGEAAPQPGDLLCAGRHERAAMTLAEVPAGNFPSHCAIVVAVDPGQVSVLGGNVADAVAMTHVPAAADGRLVGADGAVLDKRFGWFVVIRPPYAGG